MRRRSARRMTTVLFLLAAYAPRGEAVAQEDRRAGVVEEIVVTARRIEESMQDAPLSVTAFATADLEQMGVSEAWDVAGATPNLSIRKQSSSVDNYALSIRGVGAGEPSLAIDPTVGLYIDGVYLARQAGMAFDIVDLERIEILRGPQGTLFGRNTIGGAINIITEKPTGELGADARLGVGTRGYNTQKLTIDLPAWNEFALKLSALRIDQDWPAESLYTGGGLGQRTATAFRAALRWTPLDTVTADYTFDFSRRESNAQLNQLTHVRPIYSEFGSQFYGGNIYEQAAANASRRRREKLPMRESSSDESTSDIDGHALIVDWAWSEAINLKSITSYRQWESFALETDFGSFPVQQEGDVIDLRSSPPSLVPAGTLIPLFSAQRLPSEQDQLSQEIQLTGERELSGQRLQYTGGVYYFQEDSFEDNPQQFVLPTSFVVNAAATGQGFPREVADALAPFISAGTGNATLLGAPFLYRNDNSSWAVYGQATYPVHLLTDFDVTVGGRFSHDRRETTLRNFLDGERGAPTTITSSGTWSEFTPSLSLDRRWTDEISTYFRFATGYRSGGFNVRALTSESFRNPFDPETLRAYELGAKSDLLGRTLRLNTAIFRLDYTDRQISQFEAGTGGASSKVVNAGQSTTHGLELESTWLPMRGLRLIAAYGFLHVSYGEFLSGPVDPITGFPTGENRDIADEAATNLYAPAHSGALSIEYELLPWRYGTLVLRTDLTAESSLAFHPQLTAFDPAGARAVLNARATLTDVAVPGGIPLLPEGNLRLALWGKNLANTGYRDFGIDFGILGFAINNYADLRRVGVDLIFEFN